MHPNCGFEQTEHHV